MNSELWGWVIGATIFITFLVSLLGAILITQNQDYAYRLEALTLTDDPLLQCMILEGSEF